MKKYLLSTALFLLVAGAVHASTITKYYSIGAIAFLERWGTQDFERNDNELYARNIVWPSGAEFKAPVCLPDSAKVTEVKAWVHDADDTLDVNFELCRAQLDYTPGSETMALLKSSGASGEQELIDGTIDYSVINNATYLYLVKVNLRVPNSNQIFRCVRIKYEITTFGKEESKAVVPQRFSISQNRPNPSSGVTDIAYQLSKKSKVSLKVYDSSGRIVRTLVDGEQDAGHYTSTWYGKDNSTQTVPNGNYFYRLNIDGKAVTKKAILLK